MIGKREDRLRSHDQADDPHHPSQLAVRTSHANESPMRATWHIDPTPLPRNHCATPGRKAASTQRPLRKRRGSLGFVGRFELPLPKL